MKIKKLVLGFVAMLSVVALAACGSKKAADDGKGSWEKIKAAKKVVIGLDDTFVPMGFKDESGKIVGFDVDLATAVFKEYGIEPKFQPIDWSLKESELTNKTIDLIWNGYTVTKAREKKVLFTQPYAKNEQVIITKKNNGIQKQSDLKGKIVGTQEGSSGYEAFSNQPDKLKDLVKNQDAVQYASFSEAFIDLESGRIDALLIDRVYSDYYLKQAGKTTDYTTFGAGFATDDFAVGARKEDKELVNKINQGFEKLQKDGKYAEISKKWFGEEWQLPKK